MVVRQLPAATARSAALNSTCTSFSASLKVAGETCGPTAGAVPKAGGAPGGGMAASGAGFRHADAAAARPMDARLKNCLRDLDILRGYCVGPTLGGQLWGEEAA